MGSNNVNIWASSTGGSWNILTSDAGGGASGTGGVSLSLNTWHHIAFVRSGNDWMLFIDGNLDVHQVRTEANTFSHIVDLIILVNA